MDQHNFPLINDQNIQEALTGYVLGALEPEEMLAVDRYLAGHPELQATVQRLEEATAQLAYTAPQATPPRFVKARLMARARNEVRATQRSTAQPEVQAEPTHPFVHRAVAAPPRTQAPYHPLSRDQANGGWQSNKSGRAGWQGIRLAWRLAGMGVTAALLYFMGIAYLQQLRLKEIANRLETVQTQVAAAQKNVETLQQQTQEAQQTNATLRQQNVEIEERNSDLQERNVALETAWQERQQQIAALLNARQVIELRASGNGADGRGTLFIAENSTSLLVHGLKPLPANQVYALWLIPEGDPPVLAGSILVFNQDDPTLEVNLKLPVANFANVGLTIEPAQVGALPTGDLVLSGQRT